MPQDIENLFEQWLNHHHITWTLTGPESYCYIIYKHKLSNNIYRYLRMGLFFDIRGECVAYVHFHSGKAVMESFYRRKVTAVFHYDLCDPDFDPDKLFHQIVTFTT